MPSRPQGRYCQSTLSINGCPSEGLFEFSKIYPLKGANHGGGIFHSKGTRGCSAREGIFFLTSSLAKGILFGNFSQVQSRQGYAFWKFLSKRCQNSVIFVKNPTFFEILVQKTRKFGKFCQENANSEHF